MTKNASKEKTNTLPSNVTIVDGKLILSLPNAQMPVVWQMDLTKAQSAAFTILEDKKKNNYTLILKTQDGSIDEIALFDNKQTAVDVLMETSSALQNAHGKINPNTGTVNTSTAPLEKKGRNDKAGAFIALALIIVLALVWMISASGTIQQTQESNASSGSSDTNARASSGVAVSADDFLNNR